MATRPDAGNDPHLLSLGACRARPRGIGETMETAFRVPERLDRLLDPPLPREGRHHETIARRFGQTVLSFTDPDGMRLALVGSPRRRKRGSLDGRRISAEHAIRGFQGVTLLLGTRHRRPPSSPTCSASPRKGGKVRHPIQGRDGRRGIGGIVDIHAAGDFLRGRQGSGSVHHIAFRAADDEAQFAMMQKLADNHGIRTTEQKDRTISVRSTSASRAACSSRSRRTCRDLPWTSRSRRSARR